MQIECQFGTARLLAQIVRGPRTFAHREPHRCAIRHTMHGVQKLQNIRHILILFLSESRLIQGHGMIGRPLPDLKQARDPCHFPASINRAGEKIRWPGNNRIALQLVLKLNGLLQSLAIVDLTCLDFQNGAVQPNGSLDRERKNPYRNREFSNFP